VFYEGNSHTTVLLGIEDVTGRRALEREKENLLREKEVLLAEMEHRVGNSLQIIAAIILLKSRSVESEETRLHLQDAHKRGMSVAAVQRYLHVSGTAGSIEMAPYLSKLCESLKTSMIGDYHPTTLKVNSDGGSVTSREAVSLGLIVTELILNALKHAFPDNKKGSSDRGRIRRRWNQLEAFGCGQRERRTGWRLCSSKSWARHQHRQRARPATRSSG
jgi:two-component sensor histidine kinase